MSRVKGTFNPITIISEYYGFMQHSIFEGLFILGMVTVPFIVFAGVILMINYKFWAADFMAATDFIFEERERFRKLTPKHKR